MNPPPTVKSARVLSARELNAIRITGRRTVLTPEILAKISSEKMHI